MTVESRSRNAQVFLVSVLLLAVIAYVAHQLGRYLNDKSEMTPLYLLPVVYCAWFSSRRWAFFIACLTTLALHVASRDFVPSLRAQMATVAAQFITYNLVGALVAHLRIRVEHERALARADDLTGLANSRAFYETAAAEIERMRRYGKPMTCACFDLDSFKKVNDEHGHAGGDRALRLVGEALRSCVRRIDMAARIGGDEFVLLMPETDYEGAKVVTRRLRHQIAERSRDTLTCSIGCVSFTVPPRGVDELLHAADLAMYTAKSAGKDRAAFARAGSGEVEFDASEPPMALPREEAQGRGDLA